MVFVQILQDLFNTFGIPAISAEPFLNFFKGIANFTQNFSNFFSYWKELVDLLGTLQ